MHLAALLLICATTGGSPLHVVASTPQAVVLEGTCEVDPGIPLSLGLLAAPEGAVLRGTVSSPRGHEVALRVSFGEAAMVRELRVVPVALEALAPAPGPQEVRVELTLEGMAQGSPPFRGYLPDSFADLLAPYVLNWEQVVREGRPVGVRYLIIATDALAPSLSSLVDWKERKGLAPQLAPLSQTGTSDYAIRQYIRNVYTTTGTLEYVLLVGDAPALPTHEYYNPIVGGYLKSDRYYATIVGGDDLPDVFIGRLPAASATDLNVMLNKIMEYEMGVGAGPWMGRAVMASGAEHPSQPATKRAIRDMLLGFGYGMVDTVFSPGGTAVQLLQRLNEGRSILNYRGGVADAERWAEIGWTQDYCYYLQNGPRRPLVTSIICLTGNFTYTGGMYGECLGESFMRSPGGAIAFFGASQITHTYANNTLDLGIYQGLTQQGLRRIGPITDAGLFYLAFNYPFSDTVTVSLRQYNLLGDPELALWTGEPATMSVSHPASVPLGPSSVVVSTGVPGALVCLRGAGVYEAAPAGPSGQATFDIVTSSQGTIDVTVTNPGFYPYQGQITVESTYSIGGTVRTEAGAPLGGARVRLTGAATAEVVTGTTGTYVFSSLPGGGTYTVTPSYADMAGQWTFSPESRTFENLQSDQWNQDFTGIFPRYTVGGTITSVWGTPLAGVTVRLSGFQQASTTTNAQGWYEFPNLLGAESYTLTPSYTPAEGPWSFDPPSRTITLLTQHTLDQDFTGTPPFYGISGLIRTEEWRPMEGVLVVLSGAASDTVRTGSDGTYSFPAVAGGLSYAVVPSYQGPEGTWSFNPPSYQVAPLTGPQTGRNFMGIRPRYEVVGRVTTRAGQPVEGVLVRLTGGRTDSTSTTADGLFKFTQVPGGLSYTIVPSKPHDQQVSWGFVPPSVVIPNLVGSLSDVRFTAELPVVLTVGDGFGAPGSEGNAVPVELDNSTYNTSTLDSLAFVMVYSSSFGAHVPPTGGVELTERTLQWALEYRVDESYSPACSLFVTLRAQGEPLRPGLGPICHVLFSLDQTADTTYAVVLSFASASSRDTTGFPVPVDRDDTGRFGTGVGDTETGLPSGLVLERPVPNPATGEVSIVFRLPRPSRATLVIHDLTGRVRAELDQGHLPAGEHRVLWRGQSSSGTPLPNGTYHCQLVACGQSVSTLIVLLR